MNLNKNIIDYLKIAVLIFIAIFLVVINHNLLVYGRRITITSTDSRPSHKVNLLKGKGIIVGDVNAKLTITVFVDYECVFCKQFMDEVYPSIQEDYISTGKLNIEFRNLPLSMHLNSFFAAKSMVCANKFGHFFDLHSIILNKQTSISESMILTEVAALKIDTAKFLSCISDSTIISQVNADILECKRNDIRSTPTFVINGNVYVGLFGYNNFKEIIEKEINAETPQNTCH